LTERAGAGRYEEPIQLRRKEARTRAASRWDARGMAEAGPQAVENIYRPASADDVEPVARFVEESVVGVAADIEGLSHCARGCVAQDELGRQSVDDGLLPTWPDKVWVGLSAGSMVMSPPHRGGLMGWAPLADVDQALGVADFSIFPHLDHPALPENTMADAERWRAASAVGSMPSATTPRSG
jgi:hypothetical protein